MTTAMMGGSRGRTFVDDVWLSEETSGVNIKGSLATLDAVVQAGRKIVTGQAVGTVDVAGYIASTDPQMEAKLQAVFGDEATDHYLAHVFNPADIGAGGSVYGGMFRENSVEVDAKADGLVTLKGGVDLALPDRAYVNRNPLRGLALAYGERVAITTSYVNKPVVTVGATLAARVMIHLALLAGGGNLNVLIEVSPDGVGSWYGYRQYTLSSRQMYVSQWIYAEARGYWRARVRSSNGQTAVGTYLVWVQPNAVSALFNPDGVWVQDADEGYVVRGE